MIQRRRVRRPELTLAVPDHNVPTTDRSKGINDEQSKIQVDTLEKIVMNLVSNFLMLTIKDKE